MQDELKTTALHEEHRRLGGKLVSFAGYSLPIQYPAGIQAEHRSVRESAGLFDVSHMGQIEIAGPGALGLVQLLTVNDAARLAVGQAQYSAFCQADGGVLDDLLVYRLDELAYFLVVNGANRAKDAAWIEAHHSGHDARVEDRTEASALLAIQGPHSEAILQPLVEAGLGGIGYYRFLRAPVAGVPAIVARTGYTGEDGFELYLPADGAVRVWRALLEGGGSRDIAPVGLGARDTLRLEVGYALYGNDLDERHTVLESGLGWIVRFDKGDFLGRDALARQKEAGVSRLLTGIRLTVPGFPRHGYPVVSQGEPVGAVTSGTVSPTLGAGIALAYLPAGLAEPGTEVAVEIRERDVPGVVTKPPFYTEGSRKR
ncbi:MAG: glycine cleavage system aminomethyltransferase GcvT [Gemmatimonadota bacterium]